MGVSASAERSSVRVSNRREKPGKAKRSCRRRSIFFHPFISGFFLCSVLSVCSVVQSFSQDNPEQYDWFPKAAFLERKIAVGTTEEKRDALFQIRNLQTERASRIAIPALNDSDEIVRATAASSVIFLPRPEAVQVLLPLLNDKAEFVRREAAYALGEVGHSSAAATLTKTLQDDKVREVRTAAAAALGKLGDASAVDDLLSILKNKPKEDDEFLRRASARSIGQIAQTIRTGRSRIISPQNFLPEKYKQIDEPRSEELAIRFPVFRSAVGVLSKVLQDTREEDDTRREAAFALGAIGSTTAVNVLQAHRNSPDPYLAEIASEALLKIESRSRSLSSTNPNQ